MTKILIWKALREGINYISKMRFGIRDPKLFPDLKLSFKHGRNCMQNKKKLTKTK